MVNPNETFEEFMQRLVKTEPVEECVVRIAATKFFDGSRNKAKTAVKEWAKTNGHVFKYSLQ